MQLTFRPGIPVAVAAISAALGVAVIPKSLAAEPLRLAMHDMTPMPMQSPGPGMQQGQMGGMQGGGHGGMAGPMQQGQPGYPPVGGGMSAADEHTRFMEMMRFRGMKPGMGMGPAQVDMTDHIEGRIAFLHAELHITDAQTAAWNGFADALRAARQHLIEARHALMRQCRLPDLSSMSDT